MVTSGKHLNESYPIGILDICYVVSKIHWRLIKGFPGKGHQTVLQQCQGDCGSDTEVLLVYFFGPWH
jgi:hypothetical protein